MRLGMLMVDHRNVECLNIRECAKQIGVSPATLSRIERGENCDAQTLVKILAWLFEPYKSKVNRP